MKITESKLREMIRGVIREFTSSGTAVGAKKGGYQSDKTKTSQDTYDTKKAAYDTKKADYDTKKSDLDAFAGSKYRKVAKGKGYTYSSTGGGRGSGWSINPDWLTKDTAKSSAETARDTALRNKNSAKSTLDTQVASDLEKTVPKQKPQTGGGKGGFGKGKSAGKGKGKKKK